MRRTLVLVSIAALVLAACGDDDDTGAATTTTAGPTTTETTAGDDATTTTEADSSTLLPVGELETVVGDLSVPWEIAFVDETTFFVTERTGAVRVVEDGVVRDEPAVVLDAVARGEGGVLGMALHPDFPDEASAFVYYTAEDGNQVSRFDVADDLSMSGEEVILDGIPAAPTHDGGRIAFGPDGHLYVTTGDAADPSLAADLDSLAGKILRVTEDGDVPDDNPFDGSPVWSYGHRNPQGLAWTSDGVLYATEHGPSGEFGLRANDEVNQIEPGGFYGWPFAIGGRSTGQGGPPADVIDPVAASGDDDTWAPSGIAVVDGPDGEVLLVAGLRGSALLRFDLDGDDVVTRGVEVDGLGRLRIVTVGPDGCLYLGTSNTDGRGDPAADDDRILRAC
jgi:aldose sugar dehydrogenase